MGLLGNIPTAADLTASGVALEDHGAAQAKALIAEAEAACSRLIVQFLAGLGGNVDNLRNAASTWPSDIGNQLHSALDRFGVDVAVVVKPRKDLNAG